MVQDQQEQSLAETLHGEEAQLPHVCVIRPGYYRGDEQHRHPLSEPQKGSACAAVRIHLDKQAPLEVHSEVELTLGRLDPQGR